MLTGSIFYTNDKLNKKITSMGYLKENLSLNRSVDVNVYITTLYDNAVL